MTLEQTAQVMDILTTAYPQFYNGKSAPDPEQALALWASMFAEDEFAIVAAAVKALIATDEKGFPPHIGAVKARIRQITNHREMTEGEAWALVSKAIRRSGYNAAEEYAKLPRELQRMVGSPNQLREYALMDSETVQSVVASNIQRSFRASQQASRDYAALPGDVKRLAEAVGGAFAFPEQESPKTAYQLRRAVLEEGT